MTTLLVILVFVFFAIISVVYFIGWRSSRDPSVLGGVVLVWLVLVVFLLIVIFGPRKRGAENQAEAKFALATTESKRPGR